MTRFTWLVLGGVSVFVGSAAMIGGCGSDDAVIPPADSGASSSGSSGSSSGSSGSPGDGAAEASPGIDSGADAAKDGGTDAADAGELASNPGKISCGKTSCTVGTEDCCRGLNDAGCVPTGGMCFGGASLACDEKADCPGTDVCCSNAGLTGTECKATCGNGFTDVQICKTDAECTGGKCIINKCGFGMNVTIIPACKAIPQCMQ